MLFPFSRAVTCNARGRKKGEEEEEAAKKKKKTQVPFPFGHLSLIGRGKK
jgi:hypothetical protein